MDFLKRAGEILKIDMGYFFKPMLGLSANQLLKVVMTFLLSIAFANLLDPEVYGRFRYIISVIGFLSVFTLSGMGTAVVRSVARGYEGSIKQALRTEILWGLLGGLGAVLLATYYYINKRPDLSLPLFVSALFLPFYNVYSLYAAILQGKKMFRKIITYDFISQLLYSVALIALLLTTDNIFLLILPYLFLGTVLQWMWYARLRATVKLNEIKDAEMVSYGLSLSVLKGFDIAKSSLHSIMVFTILGATDLAFFYFAIAPIEQARAFLRLGEVLLLPKMASDDWQLMSFKDFFKKIIPLQGFVLLGVVVYIILSPWVFAVFFPKYLSAVYYTRLYAPTLFLTSAMVVLTSILKAKKYLKAIYVLNISEFVITLLVTIPMIYFYGIVGLIISLYILKIFQVVYSSLVIFYMKSLTERAT